MHRRGAGPYGSSRITGRDSDGVANWARITPDITTTAPTALIGENDSLRKAIPRKITTIGSTVAISDAWAAPIRAVGAAVVLAGVLLAQFATPSESRPVLIEEP